MAEKDPDDFTAETVDLQQVIVQYILEEESGLAPARKLRERMYELGYEDDEVGEALNKLLEQDIVEVRYLRSGERCYRVKESDHDSDL